MNILIIGNGFDLSHFLPTKYDHFMDVMRAIEDWDESKGDMSFDDLFSSLYEKESYFFCYTKEMYKTDEIKISVDQIKELKIQLKENVWYQYFSDHVREVKTWIDFETKIEEALAFITDGLSIIKNKFTDKGLFNEVIFLKKREGSDGYYFNELKFNIFCHLKLCTKNHNYGKTAPNAIRSDIKAGNISPTFFVVSNDEKYGFDDIKYLGFLQNQLEIL